MKGGPFGQSFALAGFGFSSFSSFCKKSTDQCEVCGLKKKKVTATVGHFSLKGKRDTHKTRKPLFPQLEPQNIQF